MSMYVVTNSQPGVVTIEAPQSQIEAMCNEAEKAGATVHRRCSCNKPTPVGGTLGVPTMNFGREIAPTELVTNDPTHSRSRGDGGPVGGSLGPAPTLAF